MCGLEVPGLAVPEDEPHDAGLEAQVGGRAAVAGAAVATPSSFPANCMPAKKACQVGSTDCGIVAPAAVHLVREFAVLAEHQRGSVTKGLHRYS